jgi:hypothetical protein
MFTTVTYDRLLTRSQLHFRSTDKELCLDMSDFNQISHDFTAFVELLKNYSESGTYAYLNKDADASFFEKKLLYVYLPDLQVFAGGIAQDCIQALFSWLKEQGVVSIMDLSIPDIIHRPMSEDFLVEHVLQHFSIERLDWRKLDVDLFALRDLAPDRSNKAFPNLVTDLGNHTRRQETPSLTDSLTKLKLYSSGNWGVLHHWASSHGLPCFKKVCIFHISTHRLNITLIGSCAKLRLRFWNRNP